ncbi:hypothetical protein SAMN05421747_1411, partial [Parapedobacter composti]
MEATGYLLERHMGVKRFFMAVNRLPLLLLAGIPCVQAHPDSLEATQQASVRPSISYPVPAYEAGGRGGYALTFPAGNGSNGVGFSQTRNYILRTTYLGRYTTPPANAPLDSVMRDITYFDGLGRP